MTATSAEDGPPLVDTSVAVALLVADHDHHETTFAAVGDRELGLAGHAAFETFSVLSRLPGPARRTPRSIGLLLSQSFPHTRFLGRERAARLWTDLPGLGIAGGAVYDALVGAAAVEHHRTLLSRDRRALETYRRLGVDIELIG